MFNSVEKLFMPYQNSKMVHRIFLKDGSRANKGRETLVYSKGAGP